MRCDSLQCDDGQRRSLHQLVVQKLFEMDRGHVRGQPWTDGQWKMWFPKMGIITPIAGWLIVENPIQLDGSSGLMKNVGFQLWLVSAGA